MKKIEEENLGFTHDVSNRNLHYYISFKLDNKNFCVEKELKRFKNYITNINLHMRGGKNLITISKKRRAGPNLILN